ncbi:hypothetical protein [Arthrobacter sp. SDTb3-6]|uniref:hypothetical protein n=1 Tax=Arthrobacter sp. SDTb3-6 TaxID=2713571 RepID=UPI00159D8836|nr:hypothetical protein [Arthrobacter sp. SDTb3-6]NVN00580.1 hypothetical protein [Arthrobacter sp. SDTb3-6]
MSDIFVEKFRGLVPLYLGEPWQKADGIDREDLDSIFAELDLTVPQALQEFLNAVGNCEELMEAYYYFWDPEELEIEDGYLLFLEDEDEAYTWGMRADQADVPDPIVWRRNNATGEWVNEEGTFSEFVLDMLDWVFNDDEDDD